MHFYGYFSFAFSLELLLFSIPFAFSFPRRNLFPLRIVVSVILFFGLNMILEDYRIIWNYVQTEPVIWVKIGTGVLYLLSLFLLALLYFSSFSIRFATSLIASVITYACQHLFYEFYDVLLLSLGLDRYGNYANFPVYWPTLILSALLMDLFLFFFLRRNRAWLEKYRFKGRWAFISLFAALFIIVMNLLVGEVKDTYAEIICGLYDFIGTTLFLVLFFYHFQFNRLEEEKEELRRTWERKKDYYEISKKNIETLNRHYHDMKHILLGIQNKEELAAPVKEMQKEIELYDSFYKTGNEYLDVVLADKESYAFQHGFVLRCFCDGKWLSFLEPVEVYTLFGNLLDNCVEAVEKLSDPSKKEITLTVKKEQGFLHIQSENYFLYEKDVSSDTSLPTTKREDKEFHGLGTKSIHLIVEDHHGVFTMKNQGDIFYCDILLPLN